MRALNRRAFIAGTCAGFGGIAAARWAAAAGVPDARDPELVVFNAKVYTVDPKMPKVEAFAVQGGKFIATGSSEEIKGLIGKKTQTMDAQQMTIVPGFIDCHNHAPGNELLYEVLVGNPYDVEFVTIQSIVDKLRAKAATAPPDTWVEGYFFDDTKLKDKRALNVHDLDQVSNELPVAVHHRGGHTSFYNSKALRMAGITKDTPGMASGTYDKDASGELNGRVTDRARDKFDNVGRRMTYSADETMRRDRDGLAYISK